MLCSRFHIRFNNILMVKQLKKQNFHEFEITSGFIMKLIKQTQENRRLGKQKQERENNVHRQIPNKFLWHKV